MIQRGLENTGSNCYFNALMQALCSCPSLLYHIKRSNTPAAKKIIELMTSNKNTHLDILDMIRRNNRHFGHGQECSHEAFMFFFDLLPSACKQLFTKKYKIVTHCPRCKLIYKKHEDYSTYIDMFGYQPNSSDEEFQDHILKSDHLTDLKCTRCNNSLYRKYILTRADDIVVCVFNQYHQKKKYNFPTALDLGRIDKKKYKLVAQIEHFGSMAGGHYTARCLRANGVFNFNDNSYLSSRFEPTEYTYMIVYSV
jgi:ubiquitin C-terminal hydrolase